jgi:6-pyruvoyltetrahydropterin/6-carboxytetrahydropterin synthase
LATYSVIVKKTFSAAHSLEGHPGRCSRLHGHTWEVEARFTGDQTDRSGMLLDFDTASGALEDVVSALDHQCLNDLVPFDSVPPTAENVARVVFERLKEITLSAGDFGVAALESVTVWESRDSAAVYSA